MESMRAIAEKQQRRFSRAAKYIRLLVKCLLILAVVSIPIVFFMKCDSSFGYDEEEVYVSPQGSKTIIVKYDFVCRPDIFKKGWLWDERVWSYPGSGFMETVHFGVEWLSEDQIRLTYDDLDDKYDEEYLITIP